GAIHQRSGFAIDRSRRRGAARSEHAQPASLDRTPRARPDQTAGVRRLARTGAEHYRPYRHATSVYRHAGDHARRVPVTNWHHRVDRVGAIRDLSESEVVRDVAIRQSLPPAIHNLAIRSGFGAGDRRPRAAILAWTAALHRRD